MRSGRILLPLVKYSIGQLLSEFNPPLIVAVDIPDYSLNKNFVFVSADQSSQIKRCERFYQKGRGRLIALENLMWDDVFYRLCSYSLFGEFGCHLLDRLPGNERLCLRKKVGHQGVLVGLVVVKRSPKSDKVTGYQLGALVNQLKEVVLRVSPGLAPNDRAGLIVYALA